MTAGYMRFSAIFSWQRCKYPITGSQRTTVSPSSSRMRRKRPCIAGCCGPMFMSMVSSPNSSLMSGLTRRPLAGSVRAPSCSARRSSPSILLPQSLEGSLGAYLEALEQRVVVEVVLPHIRPSQVGMTGESDPEHVVGLPLVPIGRRIDPRYRPYNRLISLDGRLDPHRGPAEIHELVGKLEGALPVDDGDEGEVRDAQSLAGRRQNGRNVVLTGDDPHHRADDLRFLEAVAVAEAIEVALQPALEVPFRQREGHLSVLLAIGLAVGLAAGFVLRLCCLSDLFPEPLLHLGRDPADVCLGGRWHTSTLEDVGALERSYPFEAGRLALADLRVLTVWQVLADGAVLVDEGRAGPLITYLLVALYFLLERHDPEDKRLWSRRAPRHVHVDGYHPVRAHQHGVTVKERTAGDSAGPHRYDPLGLGHLLVEAGHALGHLGRDGARDDHDVGLPRRGCEETRAESVEVVVGHTRRHHLDGAAGQAELQRPERILAGPIEEFVRTRSYEVRLVELLHHTHLRAPFFQA